MKILIPNASSPKNIGDLAILTGLLRCLRIRNKDVIIHSVDHRLHRNLPARTQPTLYSWAIFENRNPFVRSKRLVELLLHTSVISSSIKGLRPKRLSTLMDDYETADIILFTGGGYLRSQKGVTQILNLVMILLMFYVAQRMRAKTIVAPISFGPFGYRWQEKVSASVLGKFHTVFLRENTSYSMLKKYNLKNLKLSTDTSLFLPAFKQEPNEKEPYILGFTIRKWLSPIKQRKFEREFSKSIIEFSKNVPYVIRPIIQVDAPEYGDVDLKVTYRIIKNLKQNGIKVLPVQKVKDLKHAQTVYSGIDLLLGMRMHSNILSALAGTPFVAIAYEHKTTGISQDLGVKEYCIDVRKVTKEKLLDLLAAAHENNSEIKQTLHSKIKEIQASKINFI